ncbi:pyridoxal-phosphate-dependent aminotransferase family protein [Bradyrhizobium sp. BWA-3-5]|uniref:pyridoxal-phosphate-dependent aminotransferase family protein n=1 Tax=Bradyrhizobium sp. BWA-3-5 TaxID=3080013 RepID=UPI00293F0FEA|nr:aminotransferase class V-fold PLP-dependent enzyme [Bradyrhizobium sp. BWA-3-5]WOH63736.1 aminotransferase class V-fold PLP-dependent enzyme [Bradyrhizobium sp. BWA-3-5]
MKETDALLVVDSVSGVGGLEMGQDEWGVDVVVTASQKALMCPPGLGIVSVSEKAFSVIRRNSSSQRFYWDFDRASNMMKEGETPFTTPVPLVKALVMALQLMHAEDLQLVLKRHRVLFDALRVGCAALGLGDATQASQKSPTVVVSELPASLLGAQFVKSLYENFGTVIAASVGEANAHKIRIKTMGAITYDDIALDLNQIEAVLNTNGRNIEAGMGEKAARAYVRRCGMFDTLGLSSGGRQ